MQTSIKQLIRRPVFIISFTLLMALGCAFLCVSAGLWASARLSAKGADSLFTTIAALNAVEFRQMQSMHTDPPKHNPELYERAKEASAQSEHVRYARQDATLRAYSPELSAAIDPYITDMGLDYACRCLVAVAAMESFEIEAPESGGLLEYNATFKIDHGLSPAIHPAYSSYSYLTCRGTSFLKDGEVPFKIGQKYIIYSDWFTDFDSIYIFFTPDLLYRKGFADGASESGGLFEYDPDTGEVGKRVSSEKLYESSSKKTYISISSPPEIASYHELDESLEEFLLTEKGEVWNRLIEECRINHHSSQVIATDDMESGLMFHQQKSRLVEGRFISDKEYRDGARVCVLSARLAEENGVKVGDTVSLQFYNNGYFLEPMAVGDNLIPRGYQESDGFLGGGKFEVIGLYAEPEVTYASFSVNYFHPLPDFIYVPKNAVSPDWFEANLPPPDPVTGEIMDTTSSVIWLMQPELPGMYTLVLNNGSAEAFEAEMAAKGLGGLFYYFDQGYSNIAGTLDSMAGNAAIFMLVSGLAWAAVCALFLTLYLARIRKELSVMASLGAPRRRMFAHAMAAALVIALLASLAGGAAGYAAYGKAADSAYASAYAQRGDSAGLPSQDSLFPTDEEDEKEHHKPLDLASSFAMQKAPEAALYAALIQFAALIAAAAVAAACLCGKKPMELLRGVNVKGRARRVSRAPQTRAAPSAGRADTPRAQSGRSLATPSAAPQAAGTGGPILFVLAYAVKRMRRSALSCLALLFVSLAFALSLCELGYSLAGRNDALSALYRDMEVDCVISDLTGTKTDGLEISTSYIEVFATDMYNNLDEHARDLRLKRTARYLLDASEDDVELLKGDYRQSPNLIMGISRVEAAPALSPELGVEISYDEGYDETLFQGDEMVCVVPEDMAPENGKLKITMVDHIMNEEYGVLEAELTVAGTYKGGKTIYCPWEAMRELVTRAGGAAYTESMGFIAADNNRLDELKQKASKYFTNPSLTAGETKYSYALTVNDETLEEAAAAARREIRLLELMIPILLGLSTGIGFAAGYLFIRNRKPEFAVMRSMGTGHLAIFAAAFTEQLLLGVMGAAAGTGLYILIRGTGVMPDYVSLAVYLGCYALGSGLAVARVVSVNVMSVMRLNE